MQSFIGIDMAWRINGNHSGVAALVGDDAQLRLEAVSTGVTDMAGIVALVRAHAARDAVVAIDASLVVANQTGQRPCETLIAREFGKYHASCHTSNTGRPYANTGRDLVDALGQQGFRHDFQLVQARQRTGRWILEIYPHPAMVRLFRLERIIKYKKGTVAQKRAVFCGYLAWHCWRWGAERNQQFGTLEEGYIVVPRPPAP